MGCPLLKQDGFKIKNTNKMDNFSENTLPFTDTDTWKNYIAASPYPPCVFPDDAIVFAPAPNKCVYIAPSVVTVITGRFIGGDPDGTLYGTFT